MCAHRAIVRIENKTLMNGYAPFGVVDRPAGRFSIKGPP
jgi:hypothetical protein